MVRADRNPYNNFVSPPPSQIAEKEQRQEATDNLEGVKSKLDRIDGWILYAFRLISSVGIRRGQGEGMGDGQGYQMM